MTNLPYKTLIIDDEPPARERLHNLLVDFSETFHIVGEAANAKEGIEKINSLQPDIIFLDIQMPGTTGFEMLSQLTEVPIVIFCTAYDEYSLQAFETNSVDYLLKPVRKERLAQTIEKLAFFKRDYRTADILGLLEKISKQSAIKKELTSISVRKGKRLIFVKLEDIAYFKAGDKYVNLFHKNGEGHLSDQTLIQLQAQLPEYFLRIHRSVIINTNMVHEIQTYFNSRYSIMLNDRYKSKVISGRSYQNEIKAWIGA